MVALRPSLAAALAVERVADSIFRARAAGGRPARIFGGQIMAQALAAAGQTVEPDRHVHQLHASFVGRGDPARPLTFTVGPGADRGSFARRRVVVTQGAAQILELTASFHRDEAGPQHQLATVAAADPGAVPPVGELTGYDARAQEWWARLSSWLPLDLRSNVMPGRRPEVAGDRDEARQQVWFRAPEALPDDRLVHSCAAAYASDLFLLSAAMVRHGLRHDDEGVFAVTLNHTIWFHHPLRADDWCRYDQEGLWTGAGRALSRGQMFDRTGRLVATSMQEGLLRVRDVPAPPPSTSVPDAAPRRERVRTCTSR